MTTYRFFYNLREETYQTRTEGFADPDGYLLSIHRYSSTFVDFALNLGRAHGELVFADNGFYRRIRTISDQFREESDTLFDQIKAIQDKLDRKIRRDEVPASLRKRYQALARKVRQAVYDEEKMVSFTEVIQTEQVIAPDRFICPEDMLMAVLVGLNMEPEYIGEERRFYAYRNRRSARFYGYVREGRYGDYSGTPYAVASAVSYNTAYDAGRIFAKSGVRHLAIGVGAYMADDHYMDHYQVGRKTVRLSRVVPRRYLRTALVVKGLLDGYQLVAGRMPEGMHMLGLGAPIMMLAVGLIGHGIGEFSYDATSPIKDAVEGTLYVTEPAYLKFRTRSLARYYCQNPTETWQCDCAYCQHYLKLYPFDMRQAEGWYEKQRRPKTIEAPDLREGTGLAEALPLFSEPKEGELRYAITDWRIGHNHMMLERQMKEMNRHLPKTKLDDFVRQKIGAYLEIATPTYAEAVRAALEIARDEELTG